MRVIFAGTPDFAAAPLQALLDSPHEVVAAYTQPDRPAGRGRKLQASPVKQLAEQHHVPVCQPHSLRDPQAQAQWAGWNADVAVVVAYGLILPQAALDAPRLGCINIHASLLPRWRGAAPIQRAIAAGDAETGVCFMQMEAGLDTGPVLARHVLPIGPRDTGGSLHDKLAALGGAHIVETLDALNAGSAAPEPQDDSAACYAAKLSKTESQIDWSESAANIDRQVRAFNPWPVASSRLSGEQVRIWDARPLSLPTPEPAGTIIQADAEAICVATGQGVLGITELQWPGGKRLRAAQAVNGRDLAGLRFGQ
ncbi:methionyl-tRNA formyltransferase [bacterium]|nr:methionyl-tRNA formyltransferase [bacterium]